MGPSRLCLRWHRPETTAGPDRAHGIVVLIVAGKRMPQRTLAALDSRQRLIHRADEVFDVVINLQGKEGLSQIALGTGEFMQRRMECVQTGKMELYNCEL